eukprot:TRINITY_DN40332_c0_g1_i1.p1 TRINITY_DN40332_c0_g1~~TRINITY_DN40332_c0_g1_i1.p1  ORF type:complete len:451 (+),score=81.21 TRINITY_DN40332_c0_g1_i1:115-1467(+)
MVGKADKECEDIMEEEEGEDEIDESVSSLEEHSQKGGEAAAPAGEKEMERTERFGGATADEVVAEEEEEEDVYADDAYDESESSPCSSRRQDAGTMASATDSERVIGHPIQEAGASTVEESSSASATDGASLELSHGDYDGFQLYQKFRLRLVKAFGSVPCALYEFGADHETGKLSRKDFVQMCTERVRLFSKADANVLFSHITNADPLSGSIAGFACCKDFNISAEEWKEVVEQKQRALDGSFMPFQSGQTGTSLGMYHRTITVANAKAPSAHGAGRRHSKGASEGTAGTNTSARMPSSQEKAAVPKPGQRTPRRDRRCSPGETGSSLPWRKRQIPWAPSLLAGTGGVHSDDKRFFRRATRDGEQTFAVSSKLALMDQPKFSQLGATSRAWTTVDEKKGQTVWRCPVRRSEMEAKHCVRQVDAWWPYASPRPPRRLHVSLLNTMAANGA